MNIARLSFSCKGRVILHTWDTSDRPVLRVSFVFDYTHTTSGKPFRRITYHSRDTMLVSLLYGSLGDDKNNNRMSPDTLWDWFPRFYW